MAGQVRLQPFQQQPCRRHNRSQHPRQHCSMAAALAAVALATLALAAAPAAAQSSSDITNSFSDYNFVPAGRSLYYDFVAYNYQNKTIPDVLLTLKTSGSYDSALYMYCNPAWFSATDGNNIPRPSNAIFKSEESILADTISIAHDNDIIRPPEARDPNSAAYKNFVPAFNCSVVSNDPTHGTRFQIDASYNYRNINLITQEQQVLADIWRSCCSADVNTTTRAIVNDGNGSGLDNSIDDLKCGRWAQNNDLYGGNALIPFLDFCQIAGNQCNAQGRLFKLDMSSYGLTCEFPTDAFASFPDLESLDLSANFDLVGNMTEVFGGLDGLQFLQMLDLSDCAGLRGPLVPAGEQQEAGLCLLATRLQVLNLAEIGLPDSDIPACLLDGSSTIQELRLEFNNMGGVDGQGTSIPDVFTDTSRLRVFTLLSAGIGGEIPPSMSLCKELEIVDLGDNFLSGTIPVNMGSSRFLRYLYLMNNNLTGGIPESLALHEALESLDVSNNRMSELPAGFLGAPSTARIENSPLRNLKLSHNLFEGQFPKTFPLLPSLVLLEMDHNRFSGELPSVAGMFGQLRVFNATRNLLTGPIPQTFGAAGIFTLAQINALGIQLLEEPTVANQAGVQSLPAAAQPHVFDVSANSLAGAVPSFLYANNVPSFVRPNVNVRYNKLSVRCGGQDPPPQLQYLADGVHLCPQNPPAGALPPLEESEPVDAGGGASGADTDGNGVVDTAEDGLVGEPLSRDTPPPSSGGGLPGWGAALVSIVVVGVVAAAGGWVGFTWWRARQRGDAFNIGMLDPRARGRRGFKQFNDLEMASGLDPLGFGPPAAAANPQLNGHANGTANGQNGHAPARPKRTKGGFL